MTPSANNQLTWAARAAADLILAGADSADIEAAIRTARPGTSAVYDAARREAHRLVATWCSTRMDELAATTGEIARAAWARRDEFGGGKAGALAALADAHDVPGPTGPGTDYGWSAAPALVALAAEQITWNSGALAA